MLAKVKADMCLFNNFVRIRLLLSCPHLEVPLTPLENELSVLVLELSIVPVGLAAVVRYVILYYDYFHAYLLLFYNLKHTCKLYADQTADSNSNTATQQQANSNSNSNKQQQQHHHGQQQIKSSEKIRNA